MRQPSAVKAQTNTTAHMHHPPALSPDLALALKPSKPRRRCVPAEMCLCVWESQGVIKSPTRRPKTGDVQKVCTHTYAYIFWFLIFACMYVQAKVKHFYNSYLAQSAMVHIYMYIYIHVNKYVCVCVCVCVCVFTYVCINIYMYTDTYVYMCVCVCVYIYIYIYMYTYIYMCVCVFIFIYVVYRG
jgi:hypothetical protein